MHKWSDTNSASKPACSAIRAHSRMVLRFDCGPMLRIAIPYFMAASSFQVIFKTLGSPARLLDSVMDMSRKRRKSFAAKYQGRRGVGRPSAKSRKAYNFDALLDVAVRVFLERGYDGSSLDQVARAAGITKASIYYHARGKEELLLRGAG